MNTYLFAWNPKRWPWRNLADDVREVATAGFLNDGWSCASTINIPAGSRAFLIRLGEQPKGIIGSGYTTSDPEPRDHWDPERAAAGDKTNYVDIRFDCLSDEPVIDWTELQQPPFDTFRWSIQKSGIRLPPSIAAPLQRVWALRVASGIQRPEDPAMVEAQFVLEGGKQHVAVNRYERDPRAKEACLAHHGTRCAICATNLGHVYGPLAAGFIQVHHLTPLSAIGRTYALDPVKDMIPVCPNCHAVVHLKSPPLRPSVVRRLFRRRGREEGGGEPADEPDARSGPPVLLSLPGGILRKADA